jgi:Leucine-rich repeat (LRR) protein
VLFLVVSVCLDCLYLGRFLDNLELREIPKNVLPTASMYHLNMMNCSLTSIPPDVKDMTKLEFLILQGNDLSSGLDLSALPPSLIMLMLENTKLQKLPSDFQRLPNLLALCADHI